VELSVSGSQGEHLGNACEELSPADAPRRRRALTRVGVYGPALDARRIHRLRLGRRYLYGKGGIIQTGIIRTGLIHLGSADRSNACPESGIGCEYAMRRSVAQTWLGAGFETLIVDPVLDTRWPPIRCLEDDRLKNPPLLRRVGCFLDWPENWANVGRGCDTRVTGERAGL
jgi:hypothetical protein